MQVTLKGEGKLRGSRATKSKRKRNEGRNPYNGAVWWMRILRKRRVDRGGSLPGQFRTGQETAARQSTGHRAWGDGGGFRGKGGKECALLLQLNDKSEKRKG